MDRTGEPQEVSSAKQLLQTDHTYRRTDRYEMAEASDKYYRYENVSQVILRKKNGVRVIVYR